MHRRDFLLGAVVSATLTTAFPRLAFAAAPTDRRFVFIIQRGAADGLHILAPTGDAAFAAVRASLLPSIKGGKQIGDFFTLHPKLQNIGKLVDTKQAGFIHAVASAYRDRSHFDGQNVLESGGPTPFIQKDGWMNRLLAALPGQKDRGLAMVQTVPLAMRGDITVATYTPSTLEAPQQDLIGRISALYGEDPQLAALWKSALATRKLTSGIATDSSRNAAALGAIAARLLSAQDGARIIMIESNGWDTHNAQSARMDAQLKDMDALVAAIAQGLGPLWKDTLILAATEFGRTVALNGTGGTDHGTGSMIMLAGGTPPGGGQVKTDWPGLSKSMMVDGRDLRPTATTETVISSVLASHFGVDPILLLRALYPMQPNLKPWII